MNASRHTASQRRNRFDPGPAMLGLVLFGPVIATTFLAKLGVPFGSREVPASLYLILLIMFAGLATSRLAFDIKRLAAFLGVITFLGAMQVYRGVEWSFTSFFLMVALYSTYTMSIQDKRFDVDRALRVFLNICTLIAILGVIQFAAQFVVGPNIAFFLDHFLENSGIMVEGYMNLNVLSYGSPIIKSNGVFLLEASFFSQLLAIAIITELVTSNRPWRLAIFGAGMVVSYSGTGIIILLVTMPFLIITKRRWDMILAATLGLILAIIFYEQLNLEIFVDRAFEFDDVKSSGFMRFTGAYFFFQQFLWQDTWSAFFGYGSGMFDYYGERSNLPVHDSALTKIVFEFGIIGAILNIGFLFFCVTRSTAPAMIKVGCAVMFFMAGIYTPSSHGIALTTLMWPSPANRDIQPVARSQSVLRWLGLDFSRTRRHANTQNRRSTSKRQRPRQRPQTVVNAAD